MMDKLIMDLQAVLKTTPARWYQLTENFSDDMLRLRPQAGEWCALECLLHLIDVEKSVFPTRVKALLAGENFPAFDPIAQGTKMTDDMSPTALVDEYKALRDESIQLVASLTSDDLNKTAIHSELGEVTLANLLNEWGGHDLMHLVQAERALMQPFIDGCGAWKPYFVDHDVNA